MFEYLSGDTGGHLAARVTNKFFAPGADDVIPMNLRIFSVLVLLFLASGLRAAGLPQVTHAFLQSHCLECHDSDSKKGGLDLNALAAQIDDPRAEVKWIQVFDRVQRGEMPPKKKPQPPPNEVAGFMESLGGLLSERDAARHVKAGRVPYRRLNRVEYENTLHDLLAIDIPLSPMLPEDATADGFDNVSEALRLSSSQIESYLTAADAALDAAIDLGPTVKVNETKRLTYLDVPGIQQALAKPTGSLEKSGRRYSQRYRALPDALVVFQDGPWDTIMRDSHAPIAGMYRIRVSAYAYQAAGRPPVVAKLMVSDFVHNRFGGAFDLLPDKPRVLEVTMRFKRGEMIWMSSTGCDYSPDGIHVGDVGGETYGGTGMAIQWVELEGPLLESWPPPSVKRVFGDVPIRPIAKPKRREIAYEVVSQNPVQEADRLITAFAQRAFRRPVTEKETARYLQLAHDALSQGGTLETALRRAYKAILVSPRFLFLRESTGKLDDYALASRLSYFLWSTMPDDELLKLASEGKLHEPATLRAQTERLLASPRAQAFTQNFCGQWLNLRAINATTPDRGLYPEFDDLLQAAMVKETESFFDEMLRSDLGIATLIDSDFAMLNRRLAEHYGIAGIVGEQFRKVTLPPGCHRGGVLTQASILKVTANGTLSSPVARGTWVMKRILGRQPELPPADAGSIEPDTRGATTIREQLAKHRRSASCNACHKYMDPAGFALENYDVIGGWRQAYRTQGKGTPAFDPLTHKGLPFRLGAPVDPTGELADGRTFDNIDGLKKLLLDQRVAIARNVVNNLVTYSTGAGVTFSDRKEVEGILERARSHSYGLRSLVHEVVQSSLFQSK